MSVLLAEIDALDGLQLTQLTAWLTEKTRYVVVCERAGFAALRATAETDFG